MENQTLPAQIEKVPAQSSFAIESFEHAQRVAKMLASSDMVPPQFKGNIANTMIALEVANRCGASPFMVMQNMYIVYGKPSWSSSFIIAALNSCKRFSPLRFELTGKGMEMECYAWAYETATREKIAGPTVSMAMAKNEGWLERKDSKWKTMPELMIRYRAAAFFGRLFAPEILMGMHSQDEIIDANVSDSRITTPPTNPNGGQPVTESTEQNETESNSNGVDIVTDITFENLQHLYDEKLALLTKKEMDNAKRILQNRETDSFGKLYKFLNEKAA